MTLKTNLSKCCLEPSPSWRRSTRKEGILCVICPMGIPALCPSCHSLPRKRLNKSLEKQTFMRMECYWLNNWFNLLQRQKWLSYVYTRRLARGGGVGGVRDESLPEAHMSAAGKCTHSVTVVAHSLCYCL